MTYEAYSGPVADRYTEHYVISEAGVQFKRTGELNGPVNVGTWEFDAPADSIALLFGQLGAVDCSSVKEIRPDETPVGGGSVLYVLEYEDGRTFSMWYREGITYAGAEPIVDPILDFVRGLTLPAEAAETFNFP